MRRNFIDWRFNIGPFEGLVILIALAGTVFVIWMLIDAISRRPEDYPSPGSKGGWIAGLIVGLILGFGFLGLIVAIAYLFVVKIPGGRQRAAYQQMQRPEASASPGTWTSPAPPPPPGPVPPPPANCANCGTRLPAGARFCHSCGTPVA